MNVWTLACVSGSLMPWWGWLIAGGLVLICLTIITVAAIMMRGMNAAMKG